MLAPLEWRAPSNDPSVRDDADTSPASLGRRMKALPSDANCYPAAIKSDAFSAIMFVAA